MSKNRVIIVEGNVDVIMAHQYDFKETVAISGTALSDEHIKKISSMTNNIYLCLDGDKAGIKASLKSIKLLFKSGLSILAIMLPDSKDPADILLESPEAFNEHLIKAVGIIEYVCNSWKISEDHTKHEPQFKKTFLFENVFPFLEEVSDAIIFDTYKKEISESLSISLDHVTLYYEQYKKTHKKDDTGKEIFSIVDNTKISYAMNPLEVLLYMTEFGDPEKIASAKEILLQVKKIKEEWPELDQIIEWKLSPDKMSMYSIIMNNQEGAHKQSFDFDHFKKRVTAYLFNQLRLFMKKQLNITGGIDIVKKISIIDKRIDDTK